ncbi:MAG TPA: cupin domain-containing protein [Chitinophaga sp.]
MIKAFLLYTGPDGNSHITPGRIHPGVLAATTAVHFRETPPHAAYDWHTAPVTQYVITLSGVLEFTTTGGETCTIHPGDVLVATDTTGAGHKWRLVNDEPWKRAYVIFEEGADTGFVPEQG